ncbi:heavy metal translocating P-type ATPase metal-binding domain-containing protein [Litoribacter ruber]|uniref:heavy metal translocating P-type ATPase n=1 Tax=Litoribacter ruber TaxID=702568 RepID=UPI001BDB490F|nr:heavy metal translocating P-type ATPase metal-binding domain-containing protein [Litoribacter ruber]MBT0810534.1 heavy metal translocating P-type ATPase metal-binding domain-containing protein [Litoribacter ruber]
MIEEVKVKSTCYHCGEDCQDAPIKADDREFCCQGCFAVYDLLRGNDMVDYYEMEKTPGSKRVEEHGNRWAFLDNEEVKRSLLSFSDAHISKATFYIPAVHCSSCIWLLENLHILNNNIRQATVNFTKKEVAITWQNENLSLRQLVELISKLGYAPDISLNKNEKEVKTDRSFYYKIGIAGFCFGNIMMLSLPEYLDTKNLVDPEYQVFFTFLNLILVLPVVFYSSWDFYKSAWNGLKYKYLNLDLTIALGILTIFGRSAYEMITLSGAGYMDSLSGLVFFLLIGRWYQSKTYEALGFERDYNSYFPVAATVVKEGKEETVLLKDLQVGDRILVRNQELIPADAKLMKGEGKIDYAFVTGESDPVSKSSGDFMYAGGRQTGGMIEVEIQKPVESSYLTQLWNQEVFKKYNQFQLTEVVSSLSKRFTYFIIILSIITAGYWYFQDASKIWNTVTAVLIVACPCALALVIPFSFGNVLRVLGKWGFYMKSSDSVEALATADTVVLDKTGTITQKTKGKLSFEGHLSAKEKSLVKSIVRNSTHPLSQMINNHLDEYALVKVEDFEEISGSGLKAYFNNEVIKIGSAKWVGAEKPDGKQTRVYISLGNEVKGYFEFVPQYREGLLNQLVQLKDAGINLHLLSGDNDQEKETLSPYFDELKFNQQPMEKLEYIRNLKSQGRKVIMIGDGLNDAGALQESQLGISVSDDIYHFSPACDVIMDAKSFPKLQDAMKLAKSSMKVIKIAFVLSFLYNIIGLSFAVTAQLSPIVCAILMPLSSVTIVGFVTGGIRWWASKLEKPKTRVIQKDWQTSIVPQTT